MSYQFAVVAHIDLSIGYALFNEIQRFENLFDKWCGDGSIFVCFNREYISIFRNCWIEGNLQ